MAPAVADVHAPIETRPGIDGRRCYAGLARSAATAEPLNAAKATPASKSFFISIPSWFSPARSPARKTEITLHPVQFRVRCFSATVDFNRRPASHVKRLCNAGAAAID